MTVHFHHLHQKKKSSSPQGAKFIDTLVYIGGTAGVLVFIPQLLKIWIDKSTTGVSIISWGGMFIASSFWLGYGIIHRQKPIAYVNLLAAGIQLFIVLGLLIYGK